MGGGVCVGTHSSNGAWHALPRTSIEARDNLMPRRMRWPRCGHQRHSAQHAHHPNQRMSHGCRILPESEDAAQAAADSTLRPDDGIRQDAIILPQTRWPRHIFFVATLPHGVASTLPWHRRGLPRGPLAGSADKFFLSAQPWMHGALHGSHCRRAVARGERWDAQHTVRHTLGSMNNSKQSSNPNSCFKAAICNLPIQIPASSSNLQNYCTIQSPAASGDSMLQSHWFSCPREVWTSVLHLSVAPPGRGPT